MATGLLSIGVQALQSNSSALSYTGQNIANVNTEGYTRQRVNFATQDSPILGVKINDIQRITSEYLIKQLRQDQSALSSSQQLSEKISILDQLMVSDATSLSSTLDNYFTSMQTAVDDPLFIANRQLFLAEAQSTVEAFYNFEQRLRNQQSLMDTEATAMTSNINGIAQNIANLNVRISSLASSNQNFNSLIDEREVLIKDLASYMTVNVLSSDGGITTNINLSNGEPIVVSGRAAKLSLREGNPDPSQSELFLTRGSVDIEVTDYLGTGALGGLFTYRDEVLQPVIKEVNRLAIVFSSAMNEQHRKGMDLNGEMGGNLFSPLETGIVSASRENAIKPNLADLRFYDVTELQPSDYEMRFTGPETFRVTRLSDGAIFDSSKLNELPDDAGFDLLQESGTFQWQKSDGPPSSTTLRFSLDGFTLTLRADQSPKTGDNFILQPMKDGARQMGLEVTNPRMLALASPIRVTPASSNTGNIVLQSVQVLDASDQSPLRPGQLEPPLDIRFNADGTYSVFDISDAENPVPFTRRDGSEMSNMAYTAGEAIDLESFAVSFINEPKPGDRFTIEYNTDGVSDSSNALAMAALQQAALVDGYSMQDAYGQLLAKVGTQASSAQISFSADQAVFNASEGALQSIAGVNLDEEAAKLVQYQQAYTASTRLITAYQTIFDSLISALR